MVAIAAMSVGTLAACGGSSSSSDNGKGKVYFLNFKPESNDEWQKLAKDYTKETGVEVKVQTAASGTYEQTLKSEIAKSEAPTLFQVNGPVGYQNWKKYTADMSNTDVYKELANQDVALKDGDKVVGVPYVMETYGLIYNKDILNKYFALDGAKATSMDEIDNFDTLKAVADDMQARKDELGIKGAFTSAGFDSSSDWRFKTHLANMPIYYEYKADGIIYEQMKYCDYWGFERALVSYIMHEEYNWPVLSIDRLYNNGNSGQLRTRVQAFVESMEIKRIQKNGGTK